MEEMKQSKSEKLMEKINLLAEKIENEKNPLKRTLYSIRAKMVIAKLDREIEIQNLKEQYDNEVADRVDDAEYAKMDTRSDILGINNRMREIEIQLNMDRAYDPNSRDFMFGQGEVVTNGGIEQYADILRASGRAEQVHAADKMQEMQALREELNTLKEELEARKFELEDIDFETEKENRKSERKMTALVLKTNTWTRVTDWFKSIGAGVKEAFTGNKAVTEANTNKKAIKRLNRANMKNGEKLIKQNYKQVMKELKQTYKASQRNADQNAKMVKQNAKNEAQYMQAEGIRDALDQRASTDKNVREQFTEGVKINPILKMYLSDRVFEDFDKAAFVQMVAESKSFTEEEKMEGIREIDRYVKEEEARDARNAQSREEHEDERAK